MAAIQARPTTAYFSPTKRRRYLTARAAASAEANAKLEDKYPTEDAEYENGRMYFSGYHWSQEERLVRVHKRYMRLLLRAIRRDQHHDNQD